MIMMKMMMMMMMMLMKMIMMIITPAGIPGNNDDEIQGYHFVVGNEDDGVSALSSSSIFW